MTDSGNVLGIYVGLSWTPLLIAVGYENDATRLAAQVHVAAVEASKHNHPTEPVLSTPEAEAASRQKARYDWYTGEWE